MGQTYTVNIAVKFPANDPEGVAFSTALRELFALAAKVYDDPTFKADSLKTPDELIRKLIHDTDYYPAHYEDAEDGVKRWNNSFDGSYSWQDLLAGAFDRVAPKTEWCDISVYPDYGFLRWQNDHGTVTETWKTSMTDGTESRSYTIPTEE